jgi:hypothetical protein
LSAPKKAIRINSKVYDISARRAIDPHKALRDLIKEEEGAPASIVSRTLSQPRQKKLVRHISDIRHVNRKTEKSHTLMRPAVKKPAVKPAPKKKIEEIPRVLPVNRERLTRAKTVQKSHSIKRFHHPAISQPTLQPKLQPVEVKQPSQPVAVALPALPKPPVNNWPVIDQFEKAMQEASSHLETFADETVGTKKRRKLAYAIVSAAVVFGIGLGVYHEIPTAQVKIAASKAGFSPNLPSYSPSGFGLATPLKTSYGEVTLSYKSRTDDKSFDIVQSPSLWSSQSLVDNFLASSHKQYKTVKGTGRTIYTYDNSDATWVDGGIWYKVQGNADLSDDQLLKIADSL